MPATLTGLECTWTPWRSRALQSLKTISPLYQRFRACGANMSTNCWWEHRIVALSLRNKRQAKMFIWLIPPKGSQDLTAAIAQFHLAMYSSRQILLKMLALILYLMELVWPHRSSNARLLSQNRSQTAQTLPYHKLSWAVLALIKWRHPAVTKTKPFLMTYLARVMPEIILNKVVQIPRNLPSLTT